MVITGIDNQKVLDQAFEAVKTFHPLDEKEVAAIIAKTESVAAEGKYELFKTASHFDTTARHPDWLGDDRQLYPGMVLAPCSLTEVPELECHPRRTKGGSRPVVSFRASTKQKR